MESTVPFAQTIAHLSMRKWVPWFRRDEFGIPAEDLSSWREPTNTEVLHALSLVLPVLQQLETMGLRLSITLQDEMNDGQDSKA